MNKLLITLVSLFLAVAAAGCGDLFNEQLPECQVDHRLQFRFDMNLLFTDAFHTQVSSVTVYAFDTHESLVWQKSEKGDVLAEDGYYMDINDLPAGEYDLVAWCGLDNDGERPESFVVQSPTVSASTRKDIHCRLERKYNSEGAAYSDTDLYKLFHGSLHITKEDDYNASENKTVVYTLPLVKDTNQVRIILQQLSGEDMNVEGFSFKIEDNNGHMEHDNSLRDDEMITYLEWNREVGEAGIDLSGSRADDTKIKVAIADLTVARLMEDHPTYLTITNPDGEQTARIPLVDYALITKQMYSRSMTDQEYLDRQDSYVLTFFLDQNNRWLSSSIIINSWRIVLNEYGLE